jgi:hypothetical protein
VLKVKDDVAELVAQIEESIAEADTFIDAMSL